MTDTGLHNEGAGMPRARFVAFAVNGRQGYGLLRDDGLADLSRRLADPAPKLKSLIARRAWDADEPPGRGEGPDLAPGAFTLRPPNGATSRILCVRLKCPQRAGAYSNRGTTPEYTSPSFC